MLILPSHYNYFDWQLVVRISPLASGNDATVYCRVEMMHVYHSAESFVTIEREMPFAVMIELADDTDTVVVQSSTDLSIVVRQFELYNARNVALRVVAYLRASDNPSGTFQLTDYVLAPGKTLFYRDGRFWSDTDLRDAAFVMAISDETSNLSVGNAKLTFRMPYTFRLTGLRASVNTAPAGAAIRIDIKASGTSILSSPLQIDAGHKTSVTSSSPVAIARALLNDDEEIRVDITQVGSTTPGAGAKVYFVGHILS